MSALTAGQYLDSRFRLLHPLGERDSPDVWLADDTVLGEQVSLAVLPSGSSTDRIAKLRRASSTPVFDFHRGSEFNYITLPSKDGEDPGAQAAVIIELMREQPRGADGEAPAGGTPGALMAGGPAATTPQVRLTPPPRAQPIRPITPRLARPPEERAGPVGRHRGLIPGIAVAVVVGVAGLMFFLPRDDQPPGRAASDPAAAIPPVDAVAPQAESESPATQPGRTAPLDDLRRRAYLKSQAEESAERARDLSESLQARGVTLWGDDRFALAQERISGGDARLTEGMFEAAESLYLEAIRTLQAVDTSSLDILKDLLATGRSALAAGNATAAAVAFSLAAQIDPSSRTAATGLHRAEVLDELNALLDDGARQEQLGDISGAERTYNRAVSLDPLSQAAREALARVRARIGDDFFAAEISAGLAALDRNDFQAASEAFRRAGALRPESRQVADGLIQTEEGEKLAAITAHRDGAAEMEKTERWRAAEKEYDAILRLDAAIRIAAEGVERTRARAELSEALAYHLDHPDRLAADEVFEEASHLHDRAAAVVPFGPQLRDQVAGLDALLARMRDAVRVVLESDEQTEVTIYRVGHLGKFSRHEVELRPGTYTVVGSRRGYRDVRHQLVITPGKETTILVVRCEEKV